MYRRPDFGLSMRLALILCAVLLLAIALAAYLLLPDRTTTPASGPAVTTAAATQSPPIPPTSLPALPLPPDPITLLLPHDSPPALELPAITAAVNGEPIPSDQFQTRLMSQAGLHLFGQIVDLTLAEQDCARAGIDIAGPAFQHDLQSELDRSLTDIGAAALPALQRAAALQQFLVSRGLSETEFLISLRLNACLRAMAKGKVSLTDQMLLNAFNAQYGPRLHGRLFVLRSRQDASVIRTALVDQARDIDQIAALCNARSIILPVNADVEGLQKLRDAASSLAEKQLSGIVAQPDGTFLLFYVDSREPANLTVDFESVKDQLRPYLLDQAERNWAANHLQDLRRSAVIRINDPILAQQFQQLQDQLAAATQPTPP